MLIHPFPSTLRPNNANKCTRLLELLVLGQIFLHRMDGKTCYSRHYGIVLATGIEYLFGYSTTSFQNSARRIYCTTQSLEKKLEKAIRLERVKCKTWSSILDIIFLQFHRNLNLLPLLPVLMVTACLNHSSAAQCSV